MAQDRNSNEQLIKLLVEQLRKVAEKLVPRAFGVREVGKKGVRVVELPDLEAIVRANFSDDWDDGRHVDAAQATLKHAILRLDGVFGEKYGIPGELKTKEEIAYRYFNLDGSPRMPHVKPIEFDGIDDEAASGKSHYNKVRSELVKAAGLDVSPATMKRLLQDLRRELAEILVDPAFPIFDEGVSFWTVISPDDPSYITRPEAESWYFNLPASRRKIVSFYGDAGTGKSTIARHLARYLVVDPGRIVVLYADNEDLLVRKMSDDRMVLSQVKRVEGDLGLARLYGAGPDIEKDVETGRQIAALYGKLVQEWWANGCSIFWSPGMYQQGRALAYIGDIHGAHDSFSASYKHSRDVEFSKMGALIARLGLLKINPSREQAIGREYSSIAGRDAQVALEIANDIAMQYGLETCPLTWRQHQSIKGGAKSGAKSLTSVGL